MIGQNVHQRPSAQPDDRAVKVVRAYRRSAEVLLRDINDAVHDLTFQIGGGTIIRAVDFSEIRAYVLPTENPLYNALDFSLELSIPQKMGLNLAVLNALFFGEDNSNASPPVILLAPYRVELRNAERIFQAKAFQRFRDIVNGAVNDVSAIRLDQQLMAIWREFEAAGNDEVLLRKSRQNLIEYLNEHAANLLLLIMQDKWLSPQARFKYLLENANFIDVADEKIVGRSILPAELDSSFVESIFYRTTERRLRRIDALENLGPNERIRRQRTIEARSRLDALAAAYVVRANDLIARDADSDQARRVILITRSETVLAAVADHATTSNNFRIAQYFRRPQAYAVSFLQPSSTPDERLANLRQLQRSLQLAVRAFPRTSDNSADSAGQVADPYVVDLVQDLGRLWRSAVNLTVASGNWLDTLQEGSEISEVLLSLRDQFAINELIAQTAVKLAADITLNNALLGGFEAQAEVTSGSTYVEVERQGKSNDPVFIWSKHTPITVGLYFYHEVIREARATGRSGEQALKRLLRNTPGVPVSAAFDDEDEHELEEVGRSSSLVESCLAASFLEVIDSRWDVGEIYADLAVNWPHSLDPTPRHEAFYMRAVCRRRGYDPSEERIIKGLEDLDAAGDDRRRASKDENITDVRYVFERGVHLFSWWEHIEKDKGVAFEESERVSEAGQLFERIHTMLMEEIDRHRQGAGMAHDMPESLARQLLDVANARCYLRIMAGVRDGSTIRMITELRQAMRLCGWNETTVPLAVLDTLCWATFTVQTDSSESDTLIRMVQTLAQRLPNDRRPAADQKIVRQHLALMGPRLGLDLPYLPE